MAESADSMFRRGMISGKQAGKLGLLKQTKVQPSKMANFDDRAGLNDQGGVRDSGIPETGSAHLGKNKPAGSILGAKPSRGGSVNKTAQAKIGQINQDQSPKFPVGDRTKASHGKGFASKSKGKIAKQGGPYGGGGQNTQ